jgi:hypothetical protein
MVAAIPPYKLFEFYKDIRLFIASCINKKGHDTSSPLVRAEQPDVGS